MESENCRYCGLPQDECTCEHIICMDCGASFTFTSGERSFYTEKQLAHPKRCPKCRAIKRKSYKLKEQQNEKQNTNTDKSGYKQFYK